MPEKKRKIPRIVTFDIMRGFFLIAIVNNHLNFYPNFLDWWGMRGLLLTTTAEGFFLISGMVLGVVRGAKLVGAPFKDVAIIVLKRALTLYLTYIVLVIGFTLLSWYVFADNPNVKYGIMDGHNWLQLIWDTVSFQYIYGWADYLRFYAIYIAISPLALWLLRKGMWYIVLAVSIAIWWLFPIDFHTIPWQTVELLQPIPWQLIFFIGLIIGFHWPDITEWCTKYKKALTRYVAVPVIVIAAITILINIFAAFANDIVHNAWTQMLSDKAWELRLNDFHKESLPFSRIVVFFLWFWASFLVVKKFEKPITKYIGWLLIPFGTNSLYVYTLHAIILFFVHLLFVPTIPILNFLVMSGIVALIYFAIRVNFMGKIIPH
jgi:hypothetical protein